MDLFSTFVIALGPAMEPFATSVASCVTIQSMRLRQRVVIAFSFLNVTNFFPGVDFQSGDLYPFSCRNYCWPVTFGTFLNVKSEWSGELSSFWSLLRFYRNIRSFRQLNWNWRWAKKSVDTRLTPVYILALQDSRGTFFIVLVLSHRLGYIDK